MTEAIRWIVSGRSRLRKDINHSSPTLRQELRVLLFHSIFQTVLKGKCHHPILLPGVKSLAQAQRLLGARTRTAPGLLFPVLFHALMTTTQSALLGECEFLLFLKS